MYMYIIHTNIHRYQHSCTCTLTSAINPWNEVYRTAARRRKQAATTTTLTQKDGTLTTNLHGTLLHMLKNLTPDDNQAESMNYTSRPRR